ncbi:hypothetical protein, partial [Actinoplanes sp. NPDC020271]|uniref:hypothetical protein n=1 Tax=Actinoplanes sp. NPDC020271 TaxID=3363896 RepID=UPI0037A1E902
RAVATDPDRARRLTDHAETAARSIIRPDQQAWALVTVAEAVAATDPNRAGRVLREVLAVQPWQMSLAVVAKYWPGVLLRCVDALSGNERAIDTGDTAYSTVASSRHGAGSCYPP